MTGAQLIDSFHLPFYFKTLVKGFVIARYPDYLGKEVSLTMDSDNRIVNVCLDREPIISKTFEEVEAFFNGPQAEQPDPGSAEKQPADDPAKDPGNGTGSVALVPGQAG